MSASAELGEQLGFWTLVPFGCMLLAIGILPLVAHSWFQRNRNQALIAILDEDQREALLTGELTSWTQTGNGRIIASLELAGQPITTVPFVASDDGWSFDLKGALESSGGSQ